MKEIKNLLNTKKICDGYEDEKNTTLYQAIKNLYRCLKLIYDNINDNNLKKILQIIKINI